MQSTGIVRHVDKLGRIVIPKEIRANLKIRDDDLLEIYVNDHNIILKKYELLSKFENIINGICDIYHKITSNNIIITDLNKIIETNKNIGEIYIDKNLSDKYLELLDRRKIVNSKDLVNFNITNIDIAENLKHYYFAPLIINGEIMGSVFVFSNKNEIRNEDKNIISFILKYLEKNIED